MAVIKSFSAEDILARGSIKDTDVANLRRAFYEDGTVSEAEAVTLFAIDEGCAVKAPAWGEFFHEAIIDYVVRQAEPEGYVTSENAVWLISKVSGAGKIRSRNDLELLVRVLETARWSPASLVQFCLAQVRDAVLGNPSPLRSGTSGTGPSITESEVDLIRSMIYAFGGDGNIAVTRAEAEVLFEINDALADAEVNPAWTELFVKAIANTIMAASGYAIPSREEALHAEAWLDERNEIAPGNLVGAIVQAGLGGVLAAYRDQSDEERALSRLERQRLQIVTNEEITENEAAWLNERLNRDGKITETERELLAYLRAAAPKVHLLLSNDGSKAESAA